MKNLSEYTNLSALKGATVDSAAESFVGVGGLLVAATGDSTEKAYLRQQLSMATQMGNPTWILETM